ncbi:peptidoglycan-associated lipoprotein [Luteibacter jiangsuensis]|uniref:Peptidoglycan-associated lipoprotein n=1 Tax=Luteibacter jiangsuensis TaxID=637577 RepID=A0ABT9SUR8_9GAMM|nr:OmpA family protein [Luteibacter jiangsuensis]MDQ0008289.1 peptidoglycan-associated lipoprotein [Luteibacter jiangsuensis]
MRCHRRTLVISSCLSIAALAGCSGYVKKADFDSTVVELRANDQKQQQEIDSLAEQMRQRFADYDAKIAAMKGRIRVDVAAHFAFNDSTLREEDKPLLDDFAKVVSGNFPEAVITVEGFADAAGTNGFNLRLGHARAEAVRDYLVSTGGLTADKVRAVSYGEARNRQVLPGKWGDGAEPNRRVTLVIDYAGSMASAAGG